VTAPGRAGRAGEGDLSHLIQELSLSLSVWLITIGAVLGLLVLDFLITRKPHVVSLREALGWSAFYLALPLAFGVWIWMSQGQQRGVEYYTGYLVEKSLSVDNLFVFIILLSSFAVPTAQRQRVLLIGVAGALVMRGAFIAIGAELIASVSWAFLLFGGVLLVTAVKVLRDARSGHHGVDVDDLRSVRLVRKLLPGASVTTVVVAAILGTDLVFAIDSVPAVYGITGDPYLVFATNAFALLGLRALYFVLEGALAKLVHLGFGLAAILGFIGVKLVLHWAHGVWPGVPTVPTLASLAVILGILATVTVTSLVASSRAERMPTAETGDLERV
jgi:predicted tellurium resistance membrane protein TerC